MKYKEKINSDFLNYGTCSVISFAEMYLYQQRGMENRQGGILEICTLTCTLVFTISTVK